MTAYKGLAFGSTSDSLWLAESETDRSVGNHDGVDGLRSPASLRQTAVVSKTPPMRGAVPSAMEVTNVGLDIAKHWFRVHGVDSAGSVVVEQPLRRSEAIALFQGPGALPGRNASLRDSAL